MEWTEGRKDELSRLYGTMTGPELAERLGTTARFMEECRAHTARRAKESHLRNGTYPPKGVCNANLQKGGPYRFRPGHAPLRKHRE